MTEKRKVLGRGLDTLLPSRPPAHPHPPAAGHAPAAAPAQAPGEAVQQIPVGQIDPNPYQTRPSADPYALDELAASFGPPACCSRSRFGPARMAAFS